MLVVLQVTSCEQPVLLLTATKQPSNPQASSYAAAATLHVVGHSHDTQLGSPECHTLQQVPRICHLARGSWGQLHTKR
jgi:hypothetical protein